MGESDLQAVNIENNRKCSTNFANDGEETAVDFSENLVQSFLKRGEIHDALNAYINAYSSDFPDLEIFVDGLAEKARENLSKNKNIRVVYLLCNICHGVMNDPVTLKCGHTFSKHCLLSATKSDCFECKECGKSHSRSYLLQLKTNVTVSAMIDKFWKNQNNDSKTTCQAATLVKMWDSSLCLSTDTLKKILFPDAEIHSTSLMGCLKKDGLVNLEKCEEAIKLFLICYIFDPNAIQAKEKAIKAWSRMNPDESSVNKLHHMLDNFCREIESLADDFITDRIHAANFDKQDFECSLCIRIFWEPVTTPCGHTFCRFCLNRCFDHQPTCPLCKTSLASFLADRVQSITELLELAIKTYLPEEFAERKAIYEEEMDEFYNAGKDPEHVIPLFVCTIAYPTVPCPLHVFEPRYRLMIRQCMESGSCRFGMCASIDDNIAEYGTMLEIRDVQYFSDGRSVVDTVGTGRFRILRKGERDGYNTGAVEFLSDEPPVGVDLQDLKELHDLVYKISQAWFMRLPRDTKLRILQHFGRMPEVEANYYSSPNGPSWFWWMLAILPIEPRSQLVILSMTSLLRRLKTLNRVLLHLDSSILS